MISMEPVATCDIEGRLRFNSSLQVRYGNAPYWVVAGTNFYTAEQMAEARKQERERCAAVAAKTICDTHIPTGVDIYGTRAAKAIRALEDVK